MTWAEPGTIRLAANRVVEDAGGGCLVFVKLTQIPALRAAQAQPDRAPPALEPCSGWKVPFYFSKPLPQSPFEMIGVNSVQSTSKVRVRTSGSVKYSREDSIRRQQSHRSKSMKISNSSEFSAKETKVKKYPVKPYWQWYVRVTKFDSLCQCLMCSDRLGK